MLFSRFFLPSNSGFPGDLWSYDYAKDDYYVCPEPDVHVLQINPHVHKALILASDGLWNMLRPQDAIGCVQDVEREMEKRWFKTKVYLNRKPKWTGGG